jgi:hypothetical protein
MMNEGGTCEIGKTYNNMHIHLKMCIDMLCGFE